MACRKAITKGGIWVDLPSPKADFDSSVARVVYSSSPGKHYQSEMNLGMGIVSSSFDGRQSPFEVANII
jgi:hypothetical protein